MLHAPIQLYTEAGLLQDVPANSRLLRYFAAPKPIEGVEIEAQPGDFSNSNLHPQAGGFLEEEEGYQKPSGTSCIWTSMDVEFVC